VNAVEKILSMPLEDAEAAVRAALGEQGFGVLTEIDVAATLKAKLGVDREPLKILGACNPTIAHEALTLDPSVALLLPCNVVLESVEGGTRVSAVDPTELLPGARMAELASAARTRLEAALAALPA
jgi:uncharacterized protein (DUF302 family)